uniref:BTB domain-containing protein n=1 Tax=Caenorhabditis tropicalis TaxID=1561998 RepID=A0A1I7V343_9PELO
MEIVEEEEEIPVKYRLRGETDWQLKKEAVMKLGKTEWAIRLKLCKQGENHHYYSLHVALLSPERVSRIQIKCTRDGETNSEWHQEYTFGDVQTVIVNPCLMKVSEQKYLKRRAPLLGYLFEDEEKKSYNLDHVKFEDLVEAFGVFQHRWEISADRLLHLIPIARKLGFDIWGKSLNREFSQLVYRAEPLTIVPKDKEEPTKFQFNTTLKWSVEQIESIGLSTLPDNQNLMVTWEEQSRNWYFYKYQLDKGLFFFSIIYTYTQSILGLKYLSFGFQMSRPSTSSEPSYEEINETDDDDVERSEYSEDTRTKYFDIDIHVINENGVRLISDKIRRIRDDEYTIVGSPVFALFEDVVRHSVDGTVQFEINWIENHDMEEGEEDEDSVDCEQNENDESHKDIEKIRMPGVTNGEIQCEGKLLKINKEYLSQHSEYFRGMFSKRFKEGQQDSISLPMERFDTVKLSLELVYNRRLVLTDIEISRILDFADRTCFKTLIDGLQRQLWSSKVMDISDKKWLAEQFMLTDLEIKCTMEQNEEVLREARASRKRARPVDFEDDLIEAPPAPNPERVLQEIEDEPVLNQQSSQ